MAKAADRPGRNLMRRLAQLGFPRRYVLEALPEWWESRLWESPSGFAQGAMILSRNLGLDLATLHDPPRRLAFEKVKPPKFKKRLSAGTNDVGVAQAVAYRAAVIAASAMRGEYRPLPKSAQEIRNHIVNLGGASCVCFQNLLDYCWDSGLPVIHVSRFPRGAKKFDGMATHVQGRPVVVLANNHAFGAWQVFILAHEIGHIVLGHLPEGSFLVDSDIRAAGDKEDREADGFASELLLGEDDLHYMAESRLSGERLAAAAQRMGQSQGIAPGVVALNYAHHEKRWSVWPAAMRALGILEPERDALALLRDKTSANLDPQRTDEESSRWLQYLTGIDPR